MQKRKTFFILFSILLIFAIVQPIKAIDENGNQLTSASIYQQVGDSQFQIGTFTNSTYIEGTNYTLQNDYSPFLFYAHGLLNTTLSNYGNITNTIGYGLQVYQEETYQNAMSIVFPTYQTGGFWVIDAVSETLNNTVNESAVCNITVWIDYKNGSGWLIIEEYIFNLIIEETYVPPTYESDEMNLTFVWFWLFIISLFSTSIHGVLAFRLGNGSYATIALISFAFTISFLAMLGAG